MTIMCAKELEKKRRSANATRGSCGPPSGSHPEASDSDSRAQINRPLNLAVTCFVLISEISRNLPLMFVHDS